MESAWMAAPSFLGAEVNLSAPQSHSYLSAASRAAGECAEQTANSKCRKYAELSAADRHHVYLNYLII